MLSETLHYESKQPVRSCFKCTCSRTDNRSLFPCAK